MVPGDFYQYKSKLSFNCTTQTHTLIETIFTRALQTRQNDRQVFPAAFARKMRDRSANWKTNYKNEAWNEKLDREEKKKLSGKGTTRRRSHAREEREVQECRAKLARSQPSVFSYFCSIFERADRVARELDASAKRKTWLGRGPYPRVFRALIASFFVRARK